MALRQEQRSRTRVRAGIRGTRRRSPCYRHPEEAITGICASCLRDRLHGLDFSAISSVAPPELHRCRSYVSASKCRRSSVDSHDPRGNSCDAFSSRCSMSALFDAEDLRSRSRSESRVDFNSGGLARVTYNVIESEKEVRTTDFDEEVEESNGGEFKTVKEFIDLEFQNKFTKSSSNSKILKGMAVNLLGAASTVGKKFLKWRQKTTETTKSENGIDIHNIPGEIRNPKPPLGRQDHSLIAGRKSCSHEPPRSSFEERRASWDGYMIARTIPRLAPMFSMAENDIVRNDNEFERHTLSVDDGCSSGASGSGNSISDSSSSLRQSSFDRSSSVRSSGKRHEYCTVSPNVKLVITEKELQDWHLNSGRNHSLQKVKSISTYAATDGVCISDTPVKKSVKWHMIRNALGFRTKNSETLSSNGINNHCSWSKVKPDRRSIDIGSMYSSDALEVIHRRRSVDSADAKYSSALTPLRNGKNGNSGRYRSHYIAASTLHLN